MKTTCIFSLVAVLAVGGSSAFAAATGKGTSDLASPQKRQVTVDLAARLTRPPAPAPVPDDLNSPFNPPNFSQPDPEEQKANAAAGVRSPSSGASAQANGPASVRDLLETIAARIQPTGSVVIGGKPQLTFPGAKRVTAGQVITVNYNGEDYDLDLVAIDRTTFTLRLRGEEITRPIKPTK
jgi:hypothetical protein